MELLSLRGPRRSHFSPSAICFPVYKVEMIIITFIALFILDDGLHEHKDFYRLCSASAGNITFKPLFPRLPASAHEAQTPAPTAYPQTKVDLNMRHRSAAVLVPKEALQVLLQFPFQLFPPEVLGAAFVSWLLSSGAPTSSKP